MSAPTPEFRLPYFDDRSTLCLSRIEIRVSLSLINAAILRLDQRMCTTLHTFRCIFTFYAIFHLILNTARMFIRQIVTRGVYWRTPLIELYCATFVRFILRGARIGTKYSNATQRGSCRGKSCGNAKVESQYRDKYIVMIVSLLIQVPQFRIGPPYCRRYWRGDLAESLLRRSYNTAMHMYDTQSTRNCLIITKFSRRSGRRQSTRSFRTFQSALPSRRRDYRGIIADRARSDSYIIDDGRVFSDGIARMRERSTRGPSAAQTRAS